jgi:hypothetical protein
MHNHLIKAEQVEIGDEEGHVIILLEGAGIITFFQWKGPIDWAVRKECGLLDINTKTGAGSAHGYGIDTDKDGDIMYSAYQGKLVEGHWSGEFTYVKGTGKYEGIKGKATWSAVNINPKQWLVDWEGEVDFSQR